MQTISKDDFEAWKNDPITRAIFSKIRRELVEAAQSLLSQRSLPDDYELSEIRGAYKVSENILEMTHADIS